RPAGRSGRPRGRERRRQVHVGALPGRRHAPNSGLVTLGGQPVAPGGRRARRVSVAVVWQDLALCDNLDVAANLLLGQESRRMMFSATRIYADAAAILNR